MKHYVLDIETDTNALGDGTPTGLDQRVAAVTSITIVSSDEDIIALEDKNEGRLLNVVSEFFGDSEPGIIDTWNGSVFDMVFLHDRALLHGPEGTGLLKGDFGIELVPDPLIIPKYDPLPGHQGGYQVTWFGHSHQDIAYDYKEYCLAADPSGKLWSLKPCCEHFGIKMKHVDRARVSDLSPAERLEYNISDSLGTKELVMRKAEFLGL